MKASRIGIRPVRGARGGFAGSCFPCVVVIWLVATVSCAVDVEARPGIVFPSPGAEFDDSAWIPFRADTPGGTWNSSSDGFLGTGQAIVARLGPGPHVVTYAVPGYGEAKVSLAVKASAYVPGATLRAVGTGRASRTLASGAYDIALANLGCRSVSFAMDFVPPGTASFPLGRGRISGVEADPASNARESVKLGGLVAELPGVARFLPGRSRARESRYGREEEVTPTIGSIREFRVADIERGTMSDPHVISCELVFVAGNAEFWVDRSSPIDADAFASFLSLASEIALPRAVAVCGDAAEPDGDGRLAIVLTSLLNDTGLALGFFNPCDFFPLDVDPSSAAFNPTSNRADVIYAGIPSAMDEPSGFDPAGIAATIAHEYQHLARFSRKTWPGFSAGQGGTAESAPFDEGMSHLVESLCGLGVSGGNLLFFKRYLSDTGAYSLRWQDRDGAWDSAGKRGAVSGFLYWLFVRAGGCLWSDQDPGALEDSGGISFVKASIDTGLDGWSYLERAFSSFLNSLFLEWLSELFSRDEVVPPRTDPHTGEALEIRPMMGACSSRFGGSFEVMGAARVASVDKIAVSGMSAVLLERRELVGYSIVRVASVPGNETIGAVFRMPE